MKSPRLHAVRLACGHTGVIPAQPAALGFRLDEAADRAFCKACERYLRAIEASGFSNAAAAADIARMDMRLGLPALQGSPKQVAWAVQIRRRLLEQAAASLRLLLKAILRAARAPEGVKQGYLRAHDAGTIMDLSPALIAADWIEEHPGPVDAERVLEGAAALRQAVGWIEFVRASPLASDWIGIREYRPRFGAMWTPPRGG